VHKSQNQKLECAVYVVATPIGNLRDISLRALDVLAAVDAIAAEDTRNTKHLFTHHGLVAHHLLALHRHNERAAAEKIITLLKQGHSVALVTDAGTPAISDPGALLVRAVREAGYRVIPIPGANAAMAALSAAGISTPHFLFYGFLPNKPAARRNELQTLSRLPYELIFYEAPHRILECVSDLHLIFGSKRQIVFARELTKLFETVHSCTLGEALNWLNEDANNQRGEFVLLVSGPEAQQTELDVEAKHILKILMQELPLKQAVQLTAQLSDLSRNKLYQHALQLSKPE
jgi:16S rRNA (cytidine1402-2'-O)-methyltransferase